MMRMAAGVARGEQHRRMLQLPYCSCCGGVAHVHATHVLLVPTIHTAGASSAGPREDLGAQARS